ncbi:hypothetical protein [Klebsiella quasipneumoniae]|uniref:hypothetical protein n=1 Tax=Klebsiella quasipneumoniae TaxID=1463165 RepID=UPI0024815C7E|nr:hypothetical protein [Klebsiella quasipneumoniae]
MTDITELAQRLKLEVHRAVSDFNPQMNIKTRDLKELVEALEKSQQRIDELENDEVRQRLANAEHQLYMAELAKNNLRASRKAQFRKRKAAEQRIAELESRTVTVKLPDYRNTYKGPFADEVEHQVRLALELFSSAAGIKVEAE